MTPEQKLFAKFDTVKTRFGNYISNVEENRRYYNRDFATDVVPKKWQGRLTPLIPQTARRAIDEPSDHILSFPYIKVPVRPTVKDEASEQVIAEVKRHAVNAWWDNVSRRYNVIGDAKKPFLNEGKVAIRKTLRWELVEDYPDRSEYKTTAAFNNAVKRYRNEISRLGKSEFLWNLELLDNTTVYEDPANHRDPKYVFLSYRIYREVAEDTFPGTDGKWREGGPFDEINYLEYWSKPGPIQSDGSWEPGKFIQWIEGEVVHSSDSPYPYIPVTIEDTGYGVNHNLAKPEERFVGMTQHAKDLFKAEAESMTSWQAINRLAAFPIGKARNMPQGKEMEIGPGAIIDFDGAEGDPNAEDLVWMTHPDVPQGVMAIAEKIDREANATFKTNTLSGVPQRGVDTATEADLNVRNAVAKLSGPVSALERLVVRLTRQMLMDIELVLRAPVTMYGTSKGSSTPAEVTLKPTEINGFYEVYAELRTSEQDAIQQSKARFWLEAARVSPSLSHQTAMEKGEIAEDPIAELIRRSGEDVFLGERFRMAREEAAAASMGMALQPTPEQAAASGAASDEGLLGPRSDAVLDPSAAAPVVTNAMINRDANLGGQQFLGG